ncbi:hypothetical protein ACHAXS_007061 [Conticribra weissflogii]
MNRMANNSGRKETIAPSASRAFIVALASSNSEMENKNATEAASSNSPSSKAPSAAVTIIQLASNCNLRAVIHAFVATGGNPKTIEPIPAYFK